MRPPRQRNRCSEQGEGGVHDLFPAGYRLTVLEDVGSTNAVALDAGEAGDPGRHWFVAARQSAGRGRSGRTWHSPTGNLYASLLLIDPSMVARAPDLGFLVGLAAHEALAGSAWGAIPSLRLKWPNDLLLDGAKVGGVLLEARTLSDGRLAVAAGVGINLVAHPGDTPYPANDFRSAGLAVDRDRLIVGLASAVVRLLGVWDRGHGLSVLLDRWRARAHGIGEAVSVSRSGARLQGRFSGIDERGRLILATEKGAMIIEAADLYFSTASSSA